MSFIFKMENAFCYFLAILLFLLHFDQDVGEESDSLFIDIY